MGGTPDNSVASLEVDSIVKNIAEAKAIETAETERTAELNREARRVPFSQYGLSSSTSVQILRPSNVPESNIEAYHKAYPEISSISRTMQRGIKQILKDRREGGKLKNLPFGRRFEVSSVVHNDGKYFSKRKLPTEFPRLGIALLVDESGSTSGKLISAAMTASLVIEDYCRELGIPHLIYGYTSSGYYDTAIYAYAEAEDVGKTNRYRITGMCAQGGTPTAAAMAYTVSRLEKLPADIRLLIVITDGQSADNQARDRAFNQDAERPIDRIIRHMNKNKGIVVAAGIGSNRHDVEREFGKNFMDITDIHNMPEQLLSIIKRNLIQ